jgi:hypothetical protein
MKWRTIEADGVEWEVRVVSGAELGMTDEEVLEFRTRDGLRPPRRLAIAGGAFAEMGEAELRAAYLQSRPIGGDFYGRPGKQMGDVSA